MDCRNWLLIVFAGMVCSALSAWGGTSVEERLAQLERRVAELERRIDGATTSATPSRTEPQAGRPAESHVDRAALRAKVRARYERDAAEYGQEAMREVERLYRAYSKTGDAGALDELLKRYPKATRTGCAVMYAGQRATGDEAVKWFRKAIADHGDCLYGDGACVGAYARLYLAAACEKAGRKDEAERLKEEIRTQFPDAVSHRGQLLKNGL